MSVALVLLPPPHFLQCSLPRSSFLPPQHPREGRPTVEEESEEETRIGLKGARGRIREQEPDSPLSLRGV